MEISLNQAKSLLSQGEIVAVPTETVFGMAVDAENEEALLKLYNLKGRSQEKPFVIQVARSKEVIPYLSHVPFDLEKVMEHFWPGPLTLVLPVDITKVSGLLRSQLPTAAFRVTQKEETLALIEAYGPLAITSANRSGEPSLLNAQQVEEEFGIEFPILKSEGASEFQVPSTILAHVDSSWVVLRLGSLSLHALYRVLGYYPFVTKDFNPKTLQYTLRPQLHLKGVPYDGSIKTVLGFSNRAYEGAQDVIKLGDLSKPQEIKKNLPFCLKLIEKEGYGHIWVDMDFPKSVALRKISQLLEHSASVGI